MARGEFLGNNFVSKLDCIYLNLKSQYPHNLQPSRLMLEEFVPFQCSRRRNSELKVLKYSELKIKSVHYWRYVQPGYQNIYFTKVSKNSCLFDAVPSPYNGPIYSFTELQTIIPA